MKKVAVLIPAYNEAITIEAVILDFWSYKNKNKYDYKIYVIDNNSSDNTNQISKVAMEKHSVAGEVLFVKRQGKANAIKHAFRVIDADIYIMIDADSTYWAEDVDKFIDPIIENDIDMVIGDRISSGSYLQENKRPLHNFGNGLVKKMINLIFKAKLSDIMTGYRSFSRRLVKNYPILCEGFELETDLSIFCLEHKFNILEVPIKFTDRPDGSFSKLNTVSDGFKVMLTIFNLFRIYRPLEFFSIISIVLLVMGLIFGAFPVADYIKYHYVYQVPKAILTVGLMVLSCLSFAIGLVLESVRHSQNINFELRLNGTY